MIFTPSYSQSTCNSSSNNNSTIFDNDNKMNESNNVINHHPHAIKRKHSAQHQKEERGGYEFDSYNNSSREGSTDEDENDYLENAESYESRMPGKKQQQQQQQQQERVIFSSGQKRRIVVRRERDQEDNMSMSNAISSLQIEMDEEDNKNSTSLILSDELRETLKQIDQRKTPESQLLQSSNNNNNNNKRINTGGRSSDSSAALQLVVWNPPQRTLQSSSIDHLYDDVTEEQQQQLASVYRVDEPKQSNNNLSQKRNVSQVNRILIEEVNPNAKDHNDLSNYHNQYLVEEIESERGGENKTSPTKCLDGSDYFIQDVTHLQPQPQSKQQSEQQSMEFC